MAKTLLSADSVCVVLCVGLIYAGYPAPAKALLCWLGIGLSFMVVSAYYCLKGLARYNSSLPEGKEEVSVDEFKDLVESFLPQDSRFLRYLAGSILYWPVTVWAALMALTEVENRG